MRSISIKSIELKLAEICSQNISLLNKLEYIPDFNLHRSFVRIFVYRAFKKYKDKKYPSLYCIYSRGCVSSSIHTIAEAIKEKEVIHAIPILASTYCRFSKSEYETGYNCDKCPGHLLVVVNNTLYSECMGYSCSEYHAIAVFTKRQLHFLKKEYNAKIKIL